MLRVDAQDPSRPVAQVEHERHIERPEAVEVGRVEPPRRVREANVAHGPRCIRPPGVDGPVGEPEVARQVAEQVEGHRRRRQQVGPEPLVVEALVRFGDGRPRPRRLQRVPIQEVRAGLPRVVERKTTPDQPHPSTRLRRDRVRPDGMPSTLPPARLVIAHPPTKLRHPRPPRHPILGFPAVRGLKLLLSERCVHVEIVRSTLHAPTGACRSAAVGGPPLPRARRVVGQVPSWVERSLSSISQAWSRVWKAECRMRKASVQDRMRPVTSPAL